MNRNAKIYFSLLLCIALAIYPLFYIEAAQQTINANDNLPTSRPKINSNFTELYNGMNGTRSVATGGTGQTSYTNGQILIGNSTGNTLARSTLTGTPNQITITNGAGSITISLSGTLDFDGKTIDSGDFSNNNFTNPAITGAQFNDALTLFGDAAPTTSVASRMAFDTNAWAASRGAVQVNDGTANTWLIGALTSDTPTNGQVPTWNTGGTITWETPSGSVSITDTHVPYGTGSGITSEAAFTYTAGTNTMVVGNISIPSGGTINFNSGDVVITHSADTLTLTGGSFVVDTLTVTTLSATNFTIPNGNDPDISAAGRLSWDTNGNVLRGYDGTNQVAIGRKIETIQCTVTLPNDLADSERDAFWIWSNESGMSFVVTGWKAWSDTDDTTLNIEEIDADGANNATVDAVEIATNGTGLFTGADTTITAATVENGHLLVLDFDDTDTPGQVKITIYGYFNADVN